MKLPINWLRDFVQVKETAEELGEVFTLLGAQVETIEKDVLDLEITPNRPDWLSIIGLARELGAYLNRKVKNPPEKFTDYQSKSKHLDITIEEPEFFPRVSGIILKNVNIKPGDAKLEQRLKEVAINVHNNLVDITNYVMIETGVPLHAFDLDEILGEQLILRESRPGEKIETLDEKFYELPQGSLVIEDAKRLIDLCGIKGAANSGIKNSTKSALLLAVPYNPRRIRLTSKSIGLTTDASYRFERGVDHEMMLVALERALELVHQSCPEAFVVEKIDILNRPLKPRVIKLDPARVTKLLGTKIEPAKIAAYLKRLGFEINKWQATVPSWRRYDIYFEEDLIEEVARLQGYNKLDKRVIKSEIRMPKSETNFQTIQNVKQSLTKQGFNEALTYSLVSKDEISKGAPELAKPLSPETAYYRTSLVPGLLKTIARNPWASEVNIFEIGHVFRSGNETEMIGLASTKKLPLDVATEIINPDHPLAKLNKLRRSVYVAETSYSQILENLRIEKASYEYKKVRYRTISLFPPVTRDIAIVVDQTVKPDEIVSAIQSVDDRILIVELFDEFVSQKFGAGKKSLAFHLVFDDPKKTMTDKEVNKLMDKVVKNLEQKFNAKLR